MNWAALGNLFTSDWFWGFISALALGVVAIFSFYEFVYGRKDRQLRKIEGLLGHLYYPVRTAIIIFEKTLPPKADDYDSIGNSEELKIAIQDITSKTFYKLDNKTDNSRTKFEGTPTKYNLEQLFLNAVESKITELENERKKYE
jgi:hypothetical protein